MELCGPDKRKINTQLLTYSQKVNNTFTQYACPKITTMVNPNQKQNACTLAMELNIQTFTHLYTILQKIFTHVLPFEQFWEIFTHFLAFEHFWGKSHHEAKYM